MIEYSTKDYKKQQEEEFTREENEEKMKQEEGRISTQLAKQKLMGEEFELDLFYQTPWCLQKKEKEKETSFILFEKEILNSFQFNKFDKMKENEKLFKILIETLDIFNNVLYKSNHFDFLNEEIMISCILKCIPILEEKKEMNILLNFIHLLNRDFKFKNRMNRSPILKFVLLNIFKTREDEFSLRVLREMIGYNDTLNIHATSKNEGIDKLDIEIVEKLKFLFPETIFKFIENNSLKHLFENIETPNLIWNEESRMDLIEYFTTNENCMWTDFKYKSQMKEIKVKEIYLRLWNLDTNFKIDNPNEFLKSILMLLEKEKEEENILILLDSILKLLLNFINITIHVKSFIKTFLSLFHLQSSLSVLNYLFEILSFLIQQDEEEEEDSFKSLFFKNNILSNLIVCLKSDQEEIRENCLNLVQHFPTLNNEMILLLMRFLLEGKSKKKCIILISRLNEDVLSHFFPEMLIKMMKKNPVESISFFENDTCFPEFIWNEECRQILKDFIMNQEDQELKKMEYPLPAKVDNIFIEAYVKHPLYPMVNPNVFIKSLISNIHVKKIQFNVIQCINVILGGQDYLNEKNCLFFVDYFSILLPLINEIPKDIFQILKNISLLSQGRLKLMENESVLDHFMNALKDVDFIIGYIDILIRLLIESKNEFSKMILKHSIYDSFVSILSDSSYSNTIRDKVSDIIKRIAKDRKYYLDF
jgi:hypothetical protein